MTDQEKKAFEELNQDLPKYSISEGTRRYIAMDLAKKGYRKEEEVQRKTAESILTELYNALPLFHNSKYVQNKLDELIDRFKCR